ALKQKSVPGCHGRERALERPRLACKNERRKGAELLLDLRGGIRVGIFRHLDHRLVAPGIRAPTLFHHCYSELCGGYPPPPDAASRGRGYSEGRPPMPVLPFGPLRRQPPRRSGP